MKYDDDDVNLPDLCDFAFINYKTFYTLEEIRKYEVKCLKLLDYKLTINTSFNFLCFLCYNGFINSNETVLLSTHNKSSLSKAIEKVYVLSYEILDKINKNGRLIKFDPLIIACCSIAYARKTSGLQIVWPHELENLYSIKFEKDIKQCYDIVKKMNSDEELEEIKKKPSDIPPNIIEQKVISAEPKNNKKIDSSEKKKQYRKQLGSEKFIYNISLNLNNNLQNSLSGSSNSGIMNETNFKGSFVNNLSTLTTKRVDSYTTIKNSENTSVPKKYSSVMRSNIILKKGEKNADGNVTSKRFIKSQIFMEGFKTMIKSGKGRQNEKGSCLETNISDNIGLMATKSSSIMSFSNSNSNVVPKKNSTKGIQHYEIPISNTIKDINLKPPKLDESKTNKLSNKQCAIDISLIKGKTNPKNNSNNNNSKSNANKIQLNNKPSALNKIQFNNQNKTKTTELKDITKKKK